MKGWGKVPGFVAFGFVLAAACGGRTNALEGEYTGSGADGAGADAGTTQGGSSAGRGGGASGRGGTRPIGGRPAAGEGGVAGYEPGGYGGLPQGGYYPGGYGGVYYPGGYGGIYYPGGYGGLPIGGYSGAPIGGFGGSGQDCQSCLRNACTGQLVQCLSDFGCISIFSCMQQTGCNGFQCYRPGACKKVIDQYGGPNGSSMNELLQVVVCGFTAGCSCN
ncbi:MAG TPA: hypothetical protein VHB79_28500 [Polyangiaceae bacterium]|nr:hypothetical protein [Polyangiaceae bacterium]